MKIRGRVISGSVETGVEVLLERDERVENYPVGALVKIIGEQNEYIGLISDVKIKAEKDTYNVIGSSFLKEKTRTIIASRFQNDLAKQIVEVVLLSKIGKDGIMSRADTLPNFYSPMVDIEEKDARELIAFEGESIVEIGVPKQTAYSELEVQVPVSIENLVDLSFAIYGKSGSGKTFLGNLLAMGIVEYDLMRKKKGEKGVKLLIFDMHSEYGLDLKNNKGEKIADGVGQIFGNFFKIYTPDEELAERRGLINFKIPIDKLTLQDFALIGPIYGLSSTFLNHLSSIREILRKDLCLGDLWPLGLVDSRILEEKLGSSEEGKEILARLKNRIQSCEEKEKRKISVEEISDEAKKLIKKIGGAVAMSYSSQISKLRRILDYPLALSDRVNTIDDIVNDLLAKNGRHVIISMGKYENDMPLYMMIANLVARRLRDKILEMGLEGLEPENKIVIFIEESHKFLGRETSHLSPFGEIAREMRKKGVVLCVIDQKPGELDPNVVSMIWTNFVFNLTDRRDIEQALIGVDKPDMFKKIVPTLSPREVLVFGHALRFPIVLKVREYKEAEEEFKRKLNTINKEIEKSEEILRDSGFL